SPRSQRKACSACSARTAVAFSRGQSTIARITTCAWAVGLSLLLQPPPAPFELPAPTGPYPVGTTTWRQTDKSRREPIAANSDFRSVEVLAWYPPTSRSGERAPY